MIKKKYFEILIISTIFIISLIAFFILRQNKNHNRNFVIFSHSQKIEVINNISINDLKNGNYTIYGNDGSYNTIEINENKIRVIDASCPDKICISHSFLRDDIDSDIIICAPNNLSIFYE